MPDLVRWDEWQQLTLLAILSLKVIVPCIYSPITRSYRISPKSYKTGPFLRCALKEHAYSDARFSGPKIFRKDSDAWHSYVDALMTSLS
ncbi:hypothetical protein BN2476_250136 [Paraburkholderia piptadeniae]|uniref:Uncharacterized protein n=1 Tax=Paraburkholderia piptadeniae TaxID=1701573 RepID=A0A1N7S1Q9_9BURK|nr:hypothetical protein BN2476_250136 [Paraburkholderia piptadeniae]